MDITGVIPLLGFVGIVWAAYAVIGLFLRILENSTGFKFPRREHPLTFRSIAQTFKVLWLEDRAFLSLWLMTSALLILKYFFPRPRLSDLGFMFEFLNLLCWLYFLLTFHTADFDGEDESNLPCRNQRSGEDRSRWQTGEGK